jgi:hypothetical protein
VQFGDQRRAAILPCAASDIGRLPTHLGLDGIERADGLVTVWFRSLEIIELTQGDRSCRSSIVKSSSRKQFV